MCDTTYKKAVVFIALTAVLTVGARAQEPTPSAKQARSPDRTSTRANVFLFGATPTYAFGDPYVSTSPRYVQEAASYSRRGYQPLLQDYGSDRPQKLAILIKNDDVFSPLTEAFTQTLSLEKSKLMSIYHLSDRDYNRIAALAFGILGRETKFGTSLKYKTKEVAQPLVLGIKIAERKVRESLRAFQTGQIGPLLTPVGAGDVRNSRGLTQIKKIPALIAANYCVRLSDLNDPRVTAVSTVGFLAESLKILRNRIRNARLTEVNESNIFDYVLYVYFGSMDQLVNPIIDSRTHRIVNEVATPAQNVYVQTVRRAMLSLAVYESAREPIESPRASGPK